MGAKPPPESVKIYDFQVFICFPMGADCWTPPLDKFLNTPLNIRPISLKAVYQAPISRTDTGRGLRVNLHILYLDKKIIKYQ